MTQKLHALVTGLLIWTNAFLFAELHDTQAEVHRRDFWAGQYLQCTAELADYKAMVTMDSLYYGGDTTYIRGVAQ